MEAEHIQSLHLLCFFPFLLSQSQLAETYLKAFLLTDSKRYEEVVRLTLDYTLNPSIFLEEGGFVSAESADSEVAAADGTAESREGAFYVWTSSEIQSILVDQTERNLFCWIFDVRENGNVPKEADPHGESRECTPEGPAVTVTVMTDGFSAEFPFLGRTGDLSQQNHLQRVHTLEEAAAHFNLTRDGESAILSRGSETNRDACSAAHGVLF